MVLVLKGSHSFTCTPHVHPHLSTWVCQNCSEFYSVWVQILSLWSIWYVSFCYNSLELTAADRAWPIAVTDSVLCAREDCAVLQSLWNTTTASPWQIRTAVQTHLCLLTYFWAVYSSAECGFCFRIRQMSPQCLSIVSQHRVPQILVQIIAVQGLQAARSP